MARRGLLLALLPGAGLAFAPSVSSGVAAPRAWASSACWTHASGSTRAAFPGSPTLASTRSRASGRQCGALSMELVEQPVTADEAIELIGKARTIVEADMGVKVPDMLSDEFGFLWQHNGMMSREDYLAEGKGPYSTLRTALPDIFWNSYDYRVDKYEKNRVWATTRLTGTHNGPLVFDGKEYPASGKRVEAAPECVSVVFDESGECTKITGGFCLDRGVGNTGPAGGVWGVLQAIGEPVSAWSYFPPAKVLGDVVGPTFRPKKKAGAAKLPFKEPIAIALAKQVLVAGRDDPDTLADLLADDFQAYAPIFGPLKKKELVQSTTVDLASFFEGLDVDDNWYDARVDPFEPSRVWITSRPYVKVVGPLECFGAKFEPKKQSFVGVPQTFSVTFDENGFASKMTLGCPMDSETGDSDGLANFLGIMAGLGIPIPDFFSRPAPESFRRLVDSVTPEGLKRKPAGKKAKAQAKPTSLPSLASLAPKTAPAKKPAAPVAPAAAKKPAAKANASSRPALPKKTTAAAPAKAKTTPSKATASRQPVAKPAPKVAPKVAPKTAPKAPPKPASKPTAAKPAAKTARKAAPKAAPKTAPKAAPKAAPKPVPARAAASTKSKVAASTEVPKAAGSPPSPFGGLFNFGGSGGGPAAAKADPKADPKAAPKATPKTAPKAAPKPVPARAAASTKSKVAASTEVPKAAGSPPSPFGGLFNFGGSGGGGKAESDEAGAPAPAATVTKKMPGKKEAAPKNQVPVKAAARAPAPAKPPAKKPAAATRGAVEFSPQLAQKLEEVLGSSQRLDQLSKRTDLYARGGISAMDYWATLKTALGPDGAQNLGPDIIGSLPAGNQKSALFKIFSTNG